MTWGVDKKLQFSLGFIAGLSISLFFGIVIGAISVVVIAYMKALYDSPVSVFSGKRSNILMTLFGGVIGQTIFVLYSLYGQIFNIDFLIKNISIF
jgi:hypothetical protein